jgi:hypothetical protein
LGEEEYGCSILVREPEGKRLLERPRYTCKENIEINLTQAEAVWIGFI